MSLIENIIELRIEVATQVTDMRGKAFVFSGISKVCDLASKLVSALKALGMITKCLLRKIRPGWA